MTNNCNLCGSDESNILFSISNNGNSKNVVECSNCGLIYLGNPMSLKEAKSYYDNKYYTGMDGTPETSWYISGREFRLNEANRRLDEVLKVYDGKPSGILDIGCGPGFFLEAASERGIACTGVDLSEEAAKYGQKAGLNIRQGDLRCMDGFPDKFDVVTLWASLSYLQDPKGTLQKANDLLEQDGMLVIETGDIMSRPAKYFAAFLGRRCTLFQPDNNYYFSKDTLNKMLNDTGVTSSPH